MKRDFLEGLGLEKDVINSIMAEHGKGIATIRTQNTELEAKMTEAQTSIADLKNSILNLKTEHDGVIRKIKKDSAIELALLNVKAHDSKAVLPFLDLDSIELKDGKIEGLDDQIKKLKENKGFLFQTEKQIDPEPPKKPWITEKNPTGSAGGSEEINPFQAKLNKYKR